MDTATLARVHGEPLCRAVIKDSPADFHVSEALDVDFAGNGEHLWLKIQKTGLNTADVVSELAVRFSVKPAAIGYSGMKDKQAVTEQWFSICTPEHCTLTEITPSIVVIEVQRHNRKLRHGTHSSNHFRIVLRNVEWIDDASQSAFEARLEQLATMGFPNYLGPQRFGFNGQNLRRAQAWFRQPKKRVSRQQRSLYLSAARSALFNAVCDARVRAGCWHSILDGEPLVLDGSRSFFVPDTMDDQLIKRFECKDVHTSGPWWGRGEPLSEGDCAALETMVLSDQRWQALCQALADNRLDQDRRALRAIPKNLHAQWLSDKECALEFALTPGVFATMLLHELMA